MEHKHASELLPAYLDRELGLSDALAVEQHLCGCAECQSELAQQSRMSEQLKKTTNYFSTPTHLAKRIALALPQDAPHPTRRKNWNLNWLNTGAVLATSLAVVWSASLFLALPSAQERLVEELVSGHVRSLQVDHLSDVISTDKHTVKPWFNGKLDFAPPVSDLAAQGFPLIGGRLDYVAGRTVAVLVYRHDQHPINVYVWPSEHDDVAVQTQSRMGYHLVRWAKNGMVYWAVSDMASSELESFAQTMRTQS